jgi:hypothetical protein
MGWAGGAQFRQAQALPHGRGTRCGYPGWGRQELCPYACLKALLNPQEFFFLNPRRR